MPPNEPTDFNARRAEQLKAERIQKLRLEYQNLHILADTWEESVSNMEEALSGPHDQELKDKMKEEIPRLDGFAKKARERISEIEQELESLGVDPDEEE